MQVSVPVLCWAFFLACAVLYLKINSRFVLYNTHKVTDKLYAVVVSVI